MKKAFVLPMVLMLCLILLVIGLSFLGARSLEYGSTPKYRQHARAQALAEAGMEDARVKLEKDQFFPPSGGYGQESFTYSEDVTDPDDGSMVGSYTVSIDISRRSQPFQIVRVLSIGTGGTRADPSGRYRIYAEMDVCPTDRNNSALPNPKLCRWLDWREGDIEPPLPALQLPQ